MNVQTDPRAADAEPGGLKVTHALLGGLIAWLLRLIIGSWLVSSYCTAGLLGAVAIWGISALFLAITGSALVLAVRFYRPREPQDWEEGELPGVRYIGILGILLNLTALIAIVSETVAIPFINPCEPRP